MYSIPKAIHNLTTPTPAAEETTTSDEELFEAVAQSQNLTASDEELLAAVEYQEVTASDEELASFLDDIPLQPLTSSPIPTKTPSPIPGPSTSRIPTNTPSPSQIPGPSTALGKHKRSPTVCERPVCTRPDLKALWDKKIQELNDNCDNLSSDDEFAGSGLVLTCDTVEDDQPSFSLGFNYSDSE